jgi:hypothetical protein
MTTAPVGYEPVYRWVKPILGRTPTTVVVTVVWAVLCLLVAQRATPAARARALPAEPAGSGRSRRRRGRRGWCGPPLDPTRLSPGLLRQARTRLGADQTVGVALETTRLGGWAVGMAGLVVAGRTLPMGWAVLPSPWPQGQCRATTLRRLQRLQSALPPGLRWSRVAARGLPPAVLCAPLRQAGTGCSGRRRLRAWVTGAGV